MGDMTTLETCEKCGASYRTSLVLSHRCATGETETGWPREFPKVDGWYWSRKRGSVTVLKISEGAALFGAVARWPHSDNPFFYEREFLGPISPADAEQLSELRRAAEEACKWFHWYVGPRTEDAPVSSLVVLQTLEAALNPKQPEKETRS